MKKDNFILDKKKFSSRLIMGTSLFPNHSILLKSLEASSTQIVTVSIRRIDLKSEINIFELIKKNYTLMPNTAGCYSSNEAILTAELSRESLETNWIKLELIADERTLLPDSVELLRTAQELVKKKFKIFAYCSDDPIICKKLQDVGCEAIMPMVSPIGSGLGVRNQHNLEMIREMCSVNLIVDAGIGKPSDAARVMEIGFDGVLLNSSVARSLDPISMSIAMKHAIISGRKGFLAGMIQESKNAIHSSNLKGKISSF